MPDIRLISCVGVEHDLALLPHFLEYYLDLGIDPSRVHLVLNASHEESAALSRARSILSAHGIVPADEWIAPYTSETMWEKRREVQRRFADDSDWVISADVDEFHEFPADLSTFLEYCERRKVDCVQGVFIDRLASDGRLKEVSSEAPIQAQFPIEADVMCTIRDGEEGAWWYGTVNIMACRGDVLPERGGHHPLSNGRELSYLLDRPLAEFPSITDAAFRFFLPLRVHHFKWTKTLMNSLQERLATPGVSRRGELYGRRLSDYLERNEGIALDDVSIRQKGIADSIPWRLRVAALRLRSNAPRYLRAARSKATHLVRSGTKKAAEWMS